MKKLNEFEGLTNGFLLVANSFVKQKTTKCKRLLNSTDISKLQNKIEDTFVKNGVVINPIENVQLLTNKASVFLRQTGVFMKSNHFFKGFNQFSNNKRQFSLIHYKQNNEINDDKAQKMSQKVFV
jgi:hypothetical protein